MKKVGNKKMKGFFFAKDAMHKQESNENARNSNMQWSTIFNFDHCMF